MTSSSVNPIKQLAFNNKKQLQHFHTYGSCVSRNTNRYSEQGAPSSWFYLTYSHSHTHAWCSLLVGVCAQPTLVVTVSRGFPSEDALLGSSFSTIATALESFSYNSEINSELCQFVLKFLQLCGFLEKHY